ncbi:MAG: tRNA (adenosine(37)-N6)-threonylcarbamoyltransferase complex dimerization subunit type 1 TsaB [Dokdonella sp.]
MKILAIETATEFCSVALLIDDQLLLRSEFAPRRHAELLLPMCDAVLAEAGIARNQLDAVAVGRGPGAFTGVRLGVSAAQGIALGVDCPAIAVSSLAALAEAAPYGGGSILAVIDARMGEIYAATFIRDNIWGVQLVGRETVGPASLVDLPADAACVVGSGWAAYEAVLAGRMEQSPAYSDGQRFPQADAVARLARPLFTVGNVLDPADLQPVYLRDNVALTIDQQRNSRLP